AASTQRENLSNHLLPAKVPLFRKSMRSDQNLTAHHGFPQYRATLTVLTRCVNRVLYLAFIIHLMRYPISFKIEGRELSPPLILSPMAGVTDSPFRRVAKKCGGLGLIVTEFISVEGLTRGNLRSHEMMRFKPEERPIAIQIFGYDEVRMRWAAEIA